MDRHDAVCFHAGHTGTDLVIFNPMGIQVTYLETDRALITETP